jgi:hypothetical protein
MSLYTSSLRPPLCALGINEIDMQMHKFTSFVNHIGNAKPIISLLDYGIFGWNSLEKGMDENHAQNCFDT